MSSAPEGPGAPDRSIAVIRVLFLAALAVSIAHYMDTWLRYDAYALNPNTPIRPWMMPVGWTIFTVVGFGALVQVTRRQWWPATVLFAIYSLSGLIMAMHYVDAPPGDYNGTQNVMILVQLAAGVVMLGTAGWLMFHRALPALRATDAAPTTPSSAPGG